MSAATAVSEFKELKVVGRERPYVVLRLLGATHDGVNNDAGLTAAVFLQPGHFALELTVSKTSSSWNPAGESL